MRGKLSILLFLSILTFVTVNCQKNEEPAISLAKGNKFEDILNEKLLLLQNESDALVLYKQDNEYKFNFEKDLLSFYFDSEPKVNENARVSACSKSIGTEVCSGSGLSFAKCGQSYLDQGCVLTIWRTNDGKCHTKIAQL